MYYKRNFLYFSDQSISLSGQQYSLNEISDDSYQGSRREVYALFSVG